jgi:hypothetical protein
MGVRNLVNCEGELRFGRVELFEEKELAEKSKLGNVSSGGVGGPRGDARLSRSERHRLALSTSSIENIPLLTGETLFEIGVGGFRSGEGETSLARLRSRSISG